MRILHVIPQFPYFGGRTIIGGHASCLLTLALAQQDVGHDVSIISYTHGRAGEIEIEDGPTAVSLFQDARPGTIKFGLKLRSAALAWAKPRRDQFEVVHCHSGFADYFLVSAALRKRLDLPTLHTMYCPIPESGGRWRKPLVHGMIKRWAASLEGLSAMSDHVRQSMHHYGMSDVQLTQPAVDLDRFTPARDPEPMREQLGLGDDEVAVLFVGNAKPQKNMEGVLQAMHEVRRQSPNARLIVTTELAQSSSDENLERLRRMMSDLDLEDSTIQLGIIDNMAELMNAADLLVAPFRDSFGPSDYFMAALEMMASGRPVVVSRVGGMPEVIESSFGRLVEAEDVDAISAAVQAYVDDAAARADAGQAARQYTEQHFKPSVVVDRFHTLYETMMANR